MSAWTGVGLRLPLQTTPSTLMLPIHNKYGIPSTDAQDTSGVTSATSHLRCRSCSVRHDAVPVSVRQPLRGHAGERRISISKPTAEAQCAAELIDDAAAATPDGPALVNVQSQQGLDWVVPVANTTSVLLVGGVTQLVQVLCTVFVLCICSRHWLESVRMTKHSEKNE